MGFNHLRLPICLLGLALIAHACECHAVDFQVELKFLVPSSEPKEIAKIKELLGLKDTDSKPMTIYFFDTPSLDLLHQNVVLRLRQKKGEWEVTVKERPASLRTVFDQKGKNLEKDKSVLKPAVTSLSLDAIASIATPNVPQDGDALKKIFSDSQAEYVMNHPLPQGVIRLPAIGALRWKMKALDGLEAEEWLYGDEQVLELSLKTDERSVAKTEALFIKFLKDAGIEPEEAGGLKTETALNWLVRPH